jgi:hypothetical protein
VKAVGAWGLWVASVHCDLESFDLIICSDTIVTVIPVYVLCCKFIYRIKYPIYSFINHRNSSWPFPLTSRSCVGKGKHINIQISATAETS